MNGCTTASTRPRGILSPHELFHSGSVRKTTSRFEKALLHSEHAPARHARHATLNLQAKSLRYGDYTRMRTRDALDRVMPWLFGQSRHVEARDAFKRTGSSGYPRDNSQAAAVICHHDRRQEMARSKRHNDATVTTSRAFDLPELFHFVLVYIYRSTGDRLGLVRLDVYHYSSDTCIKEDN